MERTYETPEPVELYVELGKGTLTVTATETSRSTVTVTGDQSDDVVIEQTGRRITVLAPRQRLGFLGGHESGLRVVVSVPTGSDLETRTGSADQVADGTFGTVRLKSGSGDVRVERSIGVTVIDTGSGDIDLVDIGGDLRVKSGSGDVEVGSIAGTSGVSTGSGDVTIGRTQDSSVLKSGSGSLTIAHADGDISLSAASGDLEVGTLHAGGLQAKNVSGDVVVGVPAGVPVWTDVSTLTGHVASELAAVGRPQDGEQHIEIRARSVSGDIVLKQS
ncbi:DUF4097 family beta strand repeat-containing protein [Nocardioides donggukensis]|uniref:DUF4097 family beta strand repeat protein n=1 Tax=Nocardioides donggukensis TaxID=2774019 RepID=A0A927PYI0_9ACTN|nr:DUF4097 family beta strand repeat-containing protein [Nocardioides donggukensis]MBD8868198.1 DUF4097 family beta strand repeat protein [Nocardioides donggukensis]